MHLKAIIPLLLLSSLFIMPSTAFTQTRKIITADSQPYSTPARNSFSSFTVGPNIMFATSWTNIYSYNVGSLYGSELGLDAPMLMAHTVVDDEILAFGGGALDSDQFTLFNVASQQTSTVNYGFYFLHYGMTSLGHKIYFGGGAFPSGETSDYVGVYDLDTQTLSNLTLPAQAEWLQATSVGNYVIFAGGNNKAFVFDTTTQIWTTTSIASGGMDLQSASIGRFAIFVLGNFADVFDSATQTWSTHTFNEDSTISYTFSIAKTSRYAFFVAAGTAYVFDAQSQTWSTLEIVASPPDPYCPSAAVGNYALFACDDYIAVYDTITQTFVSRDTPIYDDIYHRQKLIQAGSAGNTAAFLYYFYPYFYVLALDFTAEVVPVPDPTPYSLPPTQSYPTTPTLSPPAPTTPTSLPTPSSPSTPTTVPWSPWTMPVSNTPSITNSPSTVVSPVSNTPTSTATPVTNSPSTVVSPVSSSTPSPTNAPITSQTPQPSSDNAPTSNTSPTSSPASSSSPVTVAAPVSGSNLEVTSSASTICTTAVVYAIGAVIIMLM